MDYSRRDRTNWEPLTHIDRLYDFAFAYTNPQNTYYQNEDIYNKIVKGLEYWYERNRYTAYTDACREKTDTGRIGN